MSAVAKKVAVVVGGMRGNGWGITRHLLEQTTTPMVVYATAHPGDIPLIWWLKRNPNATSSIDDKIAEKGCELKNIGLEIEKPDAVAEFREKILEAHGPNSVSMLVNAAQHNRKIEKVAEDGTGTDAIQAVLKEVYWGSKNLAQAIIPLMPADGNSRVVHLTTPQGAPAFLKNQKLAERFRVPDMTWGHLDDLMKEYGDAIRTRHYEDTDWPNSETANMRNHLPYNLSKLALAAMVFPLSRDHPGVLINACRPPPGPGRTGWKGAHEVSTQNKLVTGDIGGVTGGFWENGELGNW
ncbi:hypothetical protein ABW21_db0203988 [Orbilia brochopaga]|nr:hypothetical protein ABW21_db0203988 [Drechslerella brochopaga]